MRDDLTCDRVCNGKDINRPMKMLGQRVMSFFACVAVVVVGFAAEARAAQEGGTNTVRQRRAKAATTRVRHSGSEVAKLKAQLVALQTTNQILSNWVRWNDFILENRDQIAKELKPKWQQMSDQLFTLGGGKGQLREFEVEEVAFYRGLMIVPTLYFTTFSDGTGVVGRLVVAADPAKDFAVVSCTMDEEARAFTREQVQQLVAGKGGLSGGAELPKPKKTFKVEISPETKNALINGSIMVGVGIISRMLAP